MKETINGCPVTVIWGKFEHCGWRDGQLQYAGMTFEVKIGEPTILRLTGHVTVAETRAQFVLGVEEGCGGIGCVASGVVGDPLRRAIRAGLEVRLKAFGGKRVSPRR